MSLGQKVREGFQRVFPTRPLDLLDDDGTGFRARWGPLDLSVDGSWVRWRDRVTGTERERPCADAHDVVLTCLAAAAASWQEGVLLRPPILIFAHRRSGSSTLQEVFETAARARLLNEPLKPRKREIFFGSGDDWQQGLRATLATCAGLKHLLEHATREENCALLQLESRRILLYRRDLLAAVLSTEVSRRAGYWGSDRERYQALEPAPWPLEEARTHIETLRQDLLFYARFVRQSGLSCVFVAYEDLYNRPWEEAWRLLCHLFEHAGLPIPRSPASELIRLLVDPRMKVNDERSQTTVSNLDQLASELASVRMLETL